MFIRSILAAAALLTAHLTAHGTQAQDLVGFDRASFGQTVLNQTESAMPGIELEAAFGNYNNESITNYSPQSVFAQLGRAVGRLDILTDAGIFPCTAFIVSDRHLLTNHHCVPGILDNPQAGATQIQAVKFVAGYTQQGVDEGTAKYDVLVQPVESHKDLDYSVLEVFGDPSAKYGTLPISARDPNGGDPYWIIGHPMGEAQRISREKCKANRPPVSNNRILHTCDTLPGNSGSPVIDASLQKVVALHHAGSKKDSVNFAVPMSLILDRSSVLVASAEAVITPPPTPTQPGQKAPGPVADGGVCDGMYDEAKAYDACFAYEAYAQQCPGHRYVGFAQGYIQSKCQTDTAPAQPTTPVVTNPTPTGPLRPWCTSSRLNPTETAICTYADLAALDEQLQQAYDGLSTRQQRESGQSAWRTSTRDACGSNRTCIANATQTRISVLRMLQIAPNTGAPQETPGNYTLSSSQCYVTVASRSSIAEVQSFISTRLADRSQVRVFRSNNGFYAITYKVISKSDENYWIPTWINQGAIPSDSYCASGRRYVAEIAWQGGSTTPAPTPSPSQQVMYVDNNNDGGLNVRTGPSSKQYPYFTELEPGTQVQIIGSSGSWSNIRIPDGRTGWVYTPLLTWTKPNVRQCWGSVVNLSPRSRYNTSTGAGYLSVRTEPSTKTGRKIMEVYLGDRVKVVARRGGWARIKCIEGGCKSPYVGTGSEIGWSSEKYLTISCM